MIKKIEISYQQMAAHFFAPSRLKPCDSQHDLLDKINKDIENRCVFIGSNTQKKHFLESWRDKPSLYYFQGNPDAGILYDCFATKFPISEDSAYCDLRFAYIDDTGQVCGATVYYDRKNPKRWFAGIIRNAKANPLDRQVTIITDLDLPEGLESEELENKNIGLALCEASHNSIIGELLSYCFNADGNINTSLEAIQSLGFAWKLADGEFERIVTSEFLQNLTSSQAIANLIAAKIHPSLEEIQQLLDYKSNNARYISRSRSKVRTRLIWHLLQKEDNSAIKKILTSPRFAAAAETLYMANQIDNIAVLNDIAIQVALARALDHDKEFIALVQNNPTLPLDLLLNLEAANIGFYCNEYQHLIEADDSLKNYFIDSPSAEYTQVCWELFRRRQFNLIEHIPTNRKLAPEIPQYLRILKEIDEDAISFLLNHKLPRGKILAPIINAKKSLKLSALIALSTDKKIQRIAKKHQTPEATLLLIELLNNYQQAITHKLFEQELPQVMAQLKEQELPQELPQAHKLAFIMRMKIYRANDINESLATNQLYARDTQAAINMIERLFKKYHITYDENKALALKPFVNQIEMSLMNLQEHLQQKGHEKKLTAFLSAKETYKQSLYQSLDELYNSRQQKQDKKSFEGKIKQAEKQFLKQALKKDRHPMIRYTAKVITNALLAASIVGFAALLWHKHKKGSLLFFSGTHSSNTLRHLDKRIIANAPSLSRPA